VTTQNTINVGDLVAVCPHEDERVSWFVGGNTPVSLTRPDGSLLKIAGFGLCYNCETRYQANPKDGFPFRLFTWDGTKKMHPLDG
jgi:hypothetical protein